MGYFTKRQNIKFYNTSGGIIQQTCYIILRVCVRCFLVLFHFFKNNIILRQIHCILQIILILYWRCYKLCRINSRQFENVKFSHWLISIHSKTWLDYMRRVCLKDDRIRQQRLYLTMLEMININVYFMLWGFHQLWLISIFSINHLVFAVCIPWVYFFLSYIFGDCVAFQ